MQLNRDRILTAAFDILAEFGLGDLTMRRLARTLDVAPGALYWHFPSKQELLGGIAERILDAVSADTATPVPQPQSDAWRERTRATASALLDQLLSVRDGAEVVAAALAAGTSAHDPAATLGDALSGSPAPDRELTGWVLSRYLLGAATDVQTAEAAGATPRTVPQVLSGVDLVLDGVAN
ncbi:TetR family transcriptional regulator [Corynebacterium sp. USCH3]|uniref:TetR/AcrR family transcriptional regulator n=1 Tax=Corynebacterium sp. USCH3 TaxID=3024840 RepID=UPI0030A678F7